MEDFLTLSVRLSILCPTKYNKNQHSLDPTCVLLPPRSKIRPADNLMTAITGALATRFDTSIGLVRQHLVHADIEEWGKVRRIDSDAGDTMQASSLRVTQDDTRDATYVRVRTTFIINPLF